MKFETFFTETQDNLSLKSRWKKFTLNFKNPEGFPSYLDDNIRTMQDELQVMKNRAQVEENRYALAGFLRNDIAYDDLNHHVKNYLFNRTNFFFDLCMRLLLPALVFIPLSTIFYGFKTLAVILFSPFLLYKLGSKKTVDAIWQPIHNLLGLAFITLTFIPEFLYNVSIKSIMAFLDVVGKRCHNTFSHDEQATNTTADDVKVVKASALEKTATAKVDKDIKHELDETAAEAMRLSGTN